MSRRLALVLLVLSMLWNALPPVVLATGAVDALTHAALHWEEVPHHHLPDGSIVEDASAASQQHVDLSAGHQPMLPVKLPPASAYDERGAFTATNERPPRSADVFPLRRPPRRN